MPEVDEHRCPVTLQTLKFLYAWPGETHRNDRARGRGLWGIGRPRLDRCS